MVGRRLAVAGALFLSCALILCGDAIPNWPAPATWSLSRSARGKTTLDVTNPLPFVGLAPCRLLDTRGNGFSGAYGPPSLAAGAARNFPLAGQCGIPSGAGAVSLNVTVTNTKGSGFIKIYPQGVSAPVVSTLNYVAGQTIANAAVVPLGTGGGVSVVAGVSGTDLVVDTNGYYSQTPATADDPFLVSNTSTTAAVIGSNSSPGGGVYGVWGRITANPAGGFSAGVRGENAGTTGSGIGVWGSQNGSGYGVYGTTPSGYGVYGHTTSGAGVLGDSVSGWGVDGVGPTYGVVGQAVGSSTGAAGVVGAALNTIGSTSGVFGESFSPSSDSAGVKGVDYSGTVPNTISLPAGVRGDSNVGFGVVGFSQQGRGVEGALLSSTGATLASGSLGDSRGYGVYYINGLGGTGTKNFVEPHPSDATKLIKYVSLEGPEAGVYFRGRSQAHRGVATIEVPESFRMVAAEEGLSIQVTPIGELARVAVTHIGLNGIAIKSSRDVEFFYTVSGVRRAYPAWDPIQENRMEFVPEGPDAKLPRYLSANETQRLIDNGTYNADGTVNMATAERAGWTKIWAEREERARAARAKLATERNRE